MYVCLCADLTESEIVEVISEGINDIDSLMDETSVCTGCGTCRCKVEEILTLSSLHHPDLE